MDFGDIVPKDAPLTSKLLSSCADRLCARYPFIRRASAGRSVMGSPIETFAIGEGPREVFYNGVHHANEWITGLVLLCFLERYARAVETDGMLCGRKAREAYGASSLHLIPLVNPDGADLATGFLTGGPYYENAREIAASYPDIPFPTGWKANIDGVDLNLQYPAGWENARRIKEAKGISRNAPRDFVGPAPLSEPESRAVYRFTELHDFDMTLSYHTQGKVIYWKYLDFEPKNAFETAGAFKNVSGYEVEETPLSSGYAGYKDWFISSYDRPGYTIEAGEGVSPLPLAQQDEIFRDNLGILTLGLFAVETDIRENI